jgi:hypothetical protein
VTGSGGASGRIQRRFERRSMRGRQAPPSLSPYPFMTSSKAAMRGSSAALAGSGGSSEVTAWVDGEVVHRVVSVWARCGCRPRRLGGLTPPTNPSLLLSGSGRVLVSSCQQQRVWSGMEEATWVAAWKAVWFRQPLPLPLLLFGVSSESTTTISRNGEAVVSATVSGGARAQRTSL